MFKRFSEQKKNNAKNILSPDVFRAGESFAAEDPIYLLQPATTVPVFQPSAPWRFPAVAAPGCTIVKAIQNHAQQAPRLAVVNLGNAYYPGGFLYIGRSAQAWEEALCLASSLYFQQPLDYPASEQPSKSPLDAMPGSSYRTENCRLLTPGQAQATTGISFTAITLAAPDFSGGHELQSGFQLQIQAAAKNYNENPVLYIQEMTLKTHAQYRHALEAGATQLLTGPLGCGAFCNSPYVLALIYAAVLQDPQYKTLAVEVVAFGANNYVFTAVFKQIQAGALPIEAQQIIQIAMGASIEFPQGTSLDMLVTRLEPFFAVPAAKRTPAIAGKAYSLSQRTAMAFAEQGAQSDEHQPLLPGEKDSCCVIS